MVNQEFMYTPGNEAKLNKEEILRSVCLMKNNSGRSYNRVIHVLIIERHVSTAQVLVRRRHDYPFSRFCVQLIRH